MAYHSEDRFYTIPKERIRRILGLDFAYDNTSNCLYHSDYIGNGVHREGDSDVHLYDYVLADEVIIVRGRKQKQGKLGTRCTITVREENKDVFLAFLQEKLGEYEY